MKKNYKPFQITVARNGQKLHVAPFGRHVLLFPFVSFLKTRTIVLFIAFEFTFKIFLNSVTHDFCDFCCFQ